MKQTGSNRNTGDVSGTLQPGDKLGKYEIVERLGSGGQAIVYKGYDSLLDRYVAIKQVAPQLAADEKFTRRFREVAQQLAKLKCEQIVTIYELIEEGGGLFVTMEFVAGHTIESTLADHPEPVEPKAVLQVIWRIAAGLTAIHKAGIVHRDVKPGNIIVGEGLRVKITDFGVAARMGSAVSMRLGTTKYMAPELFAGAQVDGRADIYSLGMIAYEMLTGRLKFNEVFRDVVRDPHSEALRWMKWHSSPEQVAKPLIEVNPDVPPALSAMVARMLAKEPSERFANVEELGVELRANFSPGAQRLVRKRRKKRRAAKDAARAAVSAVPGGAGGEESAMPRGAESEPATAEIPKEPMSLRKKLTIAGTLAGIVIAGLLVYAIVRAGQQDKIRRQVEAEYLQASNFYDKAAKAETSAEKKTNYTAAREAFAKIINNSNYKGQVAAKQAQVMRHLCRAHLGVLDRNWKATGEHATTARKAIDELQSGSRGGLLEWTRGIKRELRHFDDYVTDQRQYTKAMEAFSRAMQGGNLDIAETYLKEAGKYAMPGEQVKEIETAQQDIREKRKQEEYWAHANRGKELAKRGDVSGAMAAWNMALGVLEAARKTLPPKIYADLKKTAEGLKTALKAKTEYDAAIAQARKAEKDKNLLVAAAAYEKANKIKPSEDLLTKARDLRHNHHLQLGRQHLAAGKIREAEAELNKARSFKVSSAVETELRRLERLKNYRSLLGQGNRLFQQKKYEEALEKYNAAGKLSPGAEVRSKITDCRYHIEMNVGEGHRAKAEWDKAEAAYNRARQIKPTASDEVDARLELLRRDRTYTEYMAVAEKARKERKWSAAIASAESARKVRPTPEAESLLKLIRYEQHLAMGKDAMSRGDYNGASAYFKLARGFVATPEIDKLIREAERLKAEASPGS